MKTVMNWYRFSDQAPNMRTAVWCLGLSSFLVSTSRVAETTDSVSRSMSALVFGQSDAFVSSLRVQIPQQSSGPAPRTSSPNSDLNLAFLQLVCDVLCFAS